jgi:hypothetical protein
MPVFTQPARAARHRPAAPAANAPYALAYAPHNPTWPSILSVAHDEADGGALFVITDRPCLLTGAADGLPLTVHGAGGVPRVVLGVTQVLPVKFRLALTGAVPRGQAWSWGPPVAGGANLYDPVTNNRLNAAAGDCADVPGPYTPPPPAVVVASAYGVGGTGGWATLTFDRPVTLAPGAVPDDAITFSAGYVASSVSQQDATTLYFELATAVYTGAPWSVNRQPDWVSSPVAWPQSGNF